MHGIRNLAVFLFIREIPFCVIFCKRSSPCSFEYPFQGAVSIYAEFFSPSYSYESPLAVMNLRCHSQHLSYLPSLLLFVTLLAHCYQYLVPNPPLATILLCQCLSISHQLQHQSGRGSPVAFFSLFPIFFFFLAGFLVLFLIFFYWLYLLVFFLSFLETTRPVEREILSIAFSGQCAYIVQHYQSHIFCDSLKTIRVPSRGLRT